MAVPGHTCVDLPHFEVLVHAELDERIRMVVGLRVLLPGDEAASLVLPFG